MSPSRAMSRPSQPRERLWVPVAAPIIGAVHFMFSYTTAALWCGRIGSAGYGVDLEVVVGVYTIVALAGMGLLFIHGFRRHRYQLPVRTHDDDTPEDRRHFMAWTTMLLAGLSMLATAFIAMGIVVAGECA